MKPSPNRPIPRGDATFIGSFDFYSDGTLKFLPAGAVTPGPLPPVKIARSGNNALLSWDVSGASALLQSTAVLTASTVWTNASFPTNLLGSDYVVTVPIFPGTNAFIRLRSP